ncbi:MAG: phosphotransferase [Planctomycetes bacterium]|nr:phosphotransferase [Planctomycetota bacterium]
MSGEVANFSSGELVRVLSHYDIGIIHKVAPLLGGNKSIPKMVIVSNRGKFLLKRRPEGKESLCRTVFAHAVQIHLAKNHFPVTFLAITCDENSTILRLDNHIYELFSFTAGTRYDGSTEATIETGRQLAVFHQLLSDFTCNNKLLKSSFHDSVITRKHLKAIGSDKTTDSAKQMQDVAESLMALYNSSSIEVNALDFDGWHEQVVHGDWHPGNMLFNDHKLAVVLDFDSVRAAPAMTDLANGMLQFSIVGNRPNPIDWPDYLDQARLMQFLSGYCEVTSLDQNELDSLLYLMIETMIAEAVLPVATTGSFCNLSGLEFLKMIQRKAMWIETNHDKLTTAIKEQDKFKIINRR